MEMLLARLACLMFGHKVYLDDVAGGTQMQFCACCDWQGRIVMDHFATDEEKARMKVLNQKYGVMGIAPAKEASQIYSPARAQGGE